MPMRLLLLCCWCLVNMLSIVSAQVPIDPQNDMIWGADLIIVGTVTASDRVTLTDGRELGRTAMRVERTIKGPQFGAVSFTYRVPPTPEPGTMSAGSAMPIVLNAGMRKLVYLQRGRDGYSLPNVYLGDMPAGVDEPASADAVATILQQVPAELRFTGTIGPFYIDQPTAVTLSVTNVSKQAIRYTATPTLSGFYYALKMDGAVLFQEQLPRTTRGMVLNSTGLNILAGTASPRDQITPLLFNGSVTEQMIRLEPGETAILRATVVTQLPVSWRIFTPDSYLLTPIGVKARIAVTMDGENGAQRRLTLFTPLTMALAGFPLPAEITMQ